MATTKKETPAKTTATKTATKKSAAKKVTTDLPVQKKAPTSKPAAKKADHKPLPFNGVGEDVTMPNGQVVKKQQVIILKGILALELKGQNYTKGETAESMAQRLLDSKLKGVKLAEKLLEFTIKSVHPSKTTK